MNEIKDLHFDQLLEMIAAKIAARLLEEPGQLYPRLLTIEQASMYVGSRQAAQTLTSSGHIRTVRIDRGLFIDRLDLDRWIEDHKELAMVSDKAATC